MNKYSSYKDSELFWFKSVPKHWVKTKNKFVLVEKDDRVNENSNDFKLLSLTKKGIILRDIESGKGKFPESFDTYKIVTKEDVIFCLYDIEETPRTVGFSELDGMISGSYKIFGFTEKMIGKYFYYYFLHVDDEKGLKPFYTGLRNVVRPETFKSLDIFSPPLSEQQQIVSFLDDKTQKIDNLIHQKEKKIELLKEKRTSLINHVVTKGLDTNVEMKDSGVEWIGEIPVSWDVKPLKYISEYNLHSLGNSTNPDYELDYLEISDVNSNGKIGTPTHYQFSKSPSRCRRIVRKNDILISTVRTYLKSIGFIEKEVSDLICSTGFCVVSPKDNVIPKLLFYLIRSEWFVCDVISKSEGVSYPSIQSEKLMGVKVVLPHTSEQQQIVEYLDRQTEEIDTLIQLEQKKIDTLKEYRQSLISEVVTGKIRVCEEDNSLILNSQTV